MPDYSKIVSELKEKISSMEEYCARHGVPAETIPDMIDASFQNEWKLFLNSFEMRIGRQQLNREYGPNVTISPASDADVVAICNFFRPFVAKNQILPRDEKDIREHLENFLVAKTTDEALVGTVALRDFGEGLAEIRSLAVSESYEGHGVGTMLVKASLELARQRGTKCVFTLTIRPRLFLHCGFSQVSIMRFPDKVQNDCLQCPKKKFCDETALVLYL